MKRNLSYAVVGALVVLWLALILSGKGVLISQRRVSPGDTYVVPDWGDLGDASQQQLACRYFIGTRVRWQVFWYSPSGIMGRADCPIFVDR
jgi:hypothetical protein